MVMYIAGLYIIYVWYISKTSQVGKRISNPAVRGRRKQQDCRRDEEAGKMHRLLGLEPEGREEGVRMEGERCSLAAAHTASAADGWRLGVKSED
jgi:hypothetical protein